MTDADYYNHVLDSDRNRALMARILINTMAGLEICHVDISELRQLSHHNRIMTDAFLDWHQWNKSVSFHCGDPIIQIAEL